jgi:hypothetical protein
VATGYTRLSYLSIRGKNSFAWGEKEDIHVALDEDILIEPVVPELLNSRGSLGLKKKDHDRVLHLMVVVLLPLILLYRTQFPFSTVGGGGVYLPIPFAPFSTMGRGFVILINGFLKFKFILFYFLPLGTVYLGGGFLSFFNEEYLCGPQPCFQTKSKMK